MNNEHTKVGGHWTLSVCGLLTVFYCLTVLGFVATAPDIGLRCLLVNDQSAGNSSADLGLEIRQIIQDPSRDPRGGPRPGDILVEIARQPARTFAHFSHRLL